MRLITLAVGAFTILSLVADRSIWDGVYTEEQSKRGERVYADTCANCHAPDLTGGQVVPALTGDEFLNKWNGTTAGDLFDQIRMTMPQDNPGTLTSRQYADVLAYIFKRNKFPAGRNDLEADLDTLNAIRLERSRKPARNRVFHIV